MAGLSILTALYVPYSIYYQARIVKQWCRFCLGVQAVLSLQLILTLTSVSFSFDPFPATPLLWGICLPILIWLIVKPYWLESIKGKEAIRNLHRFQSNESLFIEMLNRQETVPLPPSTMPVFCYGNLDAANTLTIITNPFCGPCAQMHERIDKLLVANPFLKVETIVLTSNDPNEKRTKMAAHWLALQENGQDVQEAMGHWYKIQSRDSDHYIQGLSSTITESQIEKVMASFQWANNVKVNSTPTVLLNGKHIPKPYQVEDLNYLLINELTLELN